MFDAQPEAFGSYRVRDEIGSGRFGPVYRAQDDLNDRAVAVKVFDQGLTPQQAATLALALDRLCHAPLDHPSIVRPIAAGADAEFAWLAETYVEGTRLDAIVRRDGPRSFADVLLWMTQIAAALDFAAAAGIFHGALRPGDILVTDERVLLTGLGVAQALAAAGLDGPVNGPGVSPHRSLGLPMSQLDDVYSLGAVTFEAVYGRPMEDRSPLASLETPIAGVDHTRLREVLIRSLADDPDRRPATALAFAAELQRAISDIPVPTRDSELQDSHPDSDSTIPIPIPPPAPSVIDDLPLRTEDAPDAEIAFAEPVTRPDTQLRGLSILAPEPDSRTRNPESESESPFRSRNRESESRSGFTWLALTVGLAIGLIGGFAGGFVVGQRDETPPPYRAERAVPRAQREPAPDPSPAPRAGQDFTESTVPATPVDDPELKLTEPIERATPERGARDEAPARSEPAEPSGPPDPAGPASIEIVSRPAGAQVFIDGRLVGRTPLVLSDVAPGVHAVRLALPGHQRWVTRVEVAAASRARVAASLEP